MLYVTTRNYLDQFPAHKTIAQSPAPDGGQFIPFQIRKLETEELKELSRQPFLGCVASVLNRFFQLRLTRWDLEFGVGRYPVRLQTMSHRIVMVESWHNHLWEYGELVREIYALVQSGEQYDSNRDSWFETAVRIAVLFGVFGELIRAGIASEKMPVDISVVGGDFSAPVSAWIARGMGLPIGNIIICFNENSGVWNLLHHGELRTDSVAVSTRTPEADITIPAGLETMISLCCGTEEVERYLEICRRGRMYSPDEIMLQRIQHGMESSVISQERMLQTIPSVFGTSGYLHSPYTALAYAGLLDYRARTGESGYGIVLAEKSPVKDPDTVAEALKISAEELKILFRKI